MDEKKYEAGQVFISSEEYRDLVKEATEAKMELQDQRMRCYHLECDLKKAQEELAEAKRKIAEFERLLAALNNTKEA